MVSWVGRGGSPSPGGTQLSGVGGEGAEARERRRSWKLPRPACTVLAKVRVRSQWRAGATFQPRHGVESPAGLPGTGCAPERPAPVAGR